MALVDRLKAIRGYWFLVEGRKITICKQFWGQEAEWAKCVPVSVILKAAEHIKGQSPHWRKK